MKILQQSLGTLGPHLSQAQILCTMKHDVPKVCERALGASIGFQAIWGRRKTHTPHFTHRRLRKAFALWRRERKHVSPERNVETSLSQWSLILTGQCAAITNWDNIPPALVDTRYVYFPNFTPVHFCGATCVSCTLPLFKQHKTTQTLSRYWSRHRGRLQSPPQHNTRVIKYFHRELKIH